jgi:hypothetical protein
MTAIVFFLAFLAIRIESWFRVTIVPSCAAFMLVLFVLLSQMYGMPKPDIKFPFWNDTSEKGYQIVSVHADDHSIYVLVNTGSTLRLYSYVKTPELEAALKAVMQAENATAVITDTDLEEKRLDDRMYADPWNGDYQKRVYGVKPETTDNGQVLDYTNRGPDQPAK